MAISRTLVARETVRRMRRLEVDVGAEIRRLRTDAGLTLTELARVVGVHRSHIARIESAATHPSLEVLTAIGIALGADLSIRFFVGSGPRLRDRFQAPMVEALLRIVDGRWAAHPEVSVSDPWRGVIDVVLADTARSVIVAVEVQSELRRLEEQLRHAAEKTEGLARRLDREGPNHPHRDVKAARSSINGLESAVGEAIRGHAQSRLPGANLVRRGCADV